MDTCKYRLKNIWKGPMNFYDLCNNCFIEFNDQKMRRRFDLICLD